MEAVADQHNLRQYVKVCHKVVGAKWSEAKQKGSVTVVRTDGRSVMVSNRDAHKEGEAGEPFNEECDVFINATGCFNDWKWRDKRHGQASPSVAMGVAPSRGFDIR